MFLREIKEKASFLLQNWHHKHNQDLLGIDFGPDSLKIVKINSSETPFLVENLAITNLPPGAFVKDEIKDVAAVSSTLKDMLRQSHITAKSVALAIPRSIAIIKAITVDKRLSSDEIESRAWIEANRHFPDLVGDIFLDFIIVGPSPQDDSQLEISLVACRKDQINPYLEVLKSAGLNAKIVDVNCYALERALPLVTNVESSTVALINLNINLNSMIVVENNVLIHAHDQSFDGQRLLTKTNDYLKTKGAIDLDALSQDEEYKNILRENLISHIRHTMHFFYSSKHNVTIQKIILSGDCAAIPNLFLFIQQEIGIETQVANPFSALKLAENVHVEEIKTYAPALMQCCGLALSKIG